MITFYFWSFFSDNKDFDDKKDSKDQLSSMYTGEVYNQTSAKQVQVFPAQSDSHLDVALT